MALQLVPNANQWWKMYSQRGLAIITTLSGILIGLPDATKTHPIYGDVTVQSLILGLTILTSIVTGILRVIKQFDPPPAKEDGAVIDPAKVQE